MLRTGEPVSSERYEYDHPYAGKTWWNWSGVPIKGGDGRDPLHIMFIATEVSEAVRAGQKEEQAAEDARARAEEFEAVINQMADGVIIFDKAGQIVKINPAGQRLLGRGVAKGAIPDQFSDLYGLHTLDGEPFRGEDLPSSRARRGETVVGEQIVVKRPDDEEVIISASVSPLKDGAKQIVGAVAVFHDITQEKMVERLMIGLLTGGHILLEGVPGLAKTLAVRSVAECLRISFSRIQFTPDLLPADVIGTMVFDQRSQEFYPKKGPLFANLVLADEINRAPAKVQSALLEAMQEKQVTIGGETFYLGEPFLVLATQNPIEHEGTYPLPEAQLDRFMLKVHVGYPTRDAEKEIVARMASGRPIEVQRVAEAEDILAARSGIAELFMDQKVVDYIVDVVRGTREPQAVGLPELKPLIAFGASPRASIYLAQAARAHAYLRGRAYVVPEDVKAMAFDVLRHRVLLTFEAEAEDMDSERVIARILETVGVP